MATSAKRYKAPIPPQKNDRESPSKRGYGRAWQRTRLRYLANHPCCEDCEAEGRVSAATQVHHIKKQREHPGLKHAEHNLMALCKRCHDIRSAKGE